jgi:hypothetical protein
MLKTRMQTAESTWTQDEAESSSSQTDLPAAPTPQRGLKTSPKVDVVGEMVQAKEIAPKTANAKAKSGQQKASTVPVPPTRSKVTTRVLTGVQARPESNENDLAAEPEQDVIAAPRPSGIAASRTGTASAVNSKATGTRVAPANEAKNTPPVQPKVGSGTKTADTTQAPKQAQATSEQRQPTKAEVTASRAMFLKSGVFASQMSTTIQLDKSFDPAAFHAYLDQLMIDTGSPTDPVERILIEQIAMAHLRVGDLSVLASGARGDEPIKILNSATARLIGEVRKTALALAAYRERKQPAKKQPRSPGKKGKASR